MPGREPRSGRRRARRVILYRRNLAARCLFGVQRSAASSPQRRPQYPATSKQATGRGLGQVISQSPQTHG